MARSAGGVTLRYGKAYASAALVTQNIIRGYHPWMGTIFGDRGGVATNNEEDDDDGGGGGGGGGGGCDPDSCNEEEWHCQYDDAGNPDFCEHRVQACTEKGCEWINECLDASMCCGGSSGPETPEFESLGG